MLTGSQAQIFGDGEQSRDFCYIDNVVQANLLAATSTDPAVTNRVYNVGCNDRTTLTELFYQLRDALAEIRPQVAGAEPSYAPERPGDIKHSQADITSITEALGYRYTHELAEGLSATVRWFVEQHR